MSMDSMPSGIREGKLEVQETARVKFSVRFSPDALHGAKVKAIEDIGRTYRNDAHISSEKIESLEHFFETIDKLPELQFTPGVTLVFGENGSGKTTLVRALLYAAEIQRDIDGGGSREMAEERLLRPVMRGAKMDLAQAGLAPFLAKAIDVKNLTADAPLRAGKVKRPMKIDFHDATHVKADSLASDDLSARFSTASRSGMDELAGAYETNLSQRQLVDRIWQSMEQENIRDGKFGILRGFDEPETGMSPKRQRQLEENLQTLTPDGSISLVSTNNIKLFESDLPRIDLDHPERGIHRPSDYPDHE